ncbi:hypothetical protein BJ322DRAFT_998750, partial [Thelephora terrestris]
GTPCDHLGNFLPPNSPPAPPPQKANDNWTPFKSRAGFELAEVLYLKANLSQSIINHILDLWTATLIPHGDLPPLIDHQDLLTQIDAIKLGNVPWKSYTAQYQWLRPDAGPIPEWMKTEYQFWYRDPRKVIHHLLSNPEFASGIDYAPHRDFKDEERQYRDFMSGNWAWDQCDTIAMDARTHSAMFVPIILGTDKTTVSVATGQHSYHPIYLSVGNVHNRLRRAHKDTLVLIGFLPIPKGTREDAKDELFRDFRRRLFHGCLTAVNSTVKPFMLTWDLVRCSDHHFHRVIYGLGPEITDYPEQSVAAGTVYGWCVTCEADPQNLDDPTAELRTQEKMFALLEAEDDDTLWFHHGMVSDFLPFTASFPRADIYELLSPDLLHQVIKGTFKDHLVTWVEEYLKIVHGPSEGSRLLDEIDHRISLVPLFPGLRRFKQGRNFQQWTGNDSKAFMKVFTTTLEGIVSVDIIKTLAAFLDFCYIVRQDTIAEVSLTALDNALGRFHHHREIFRESGVRPTGFSLPRQHSLSHYHHHIKKFGAPNGLSSSITESKHIIAVKKPWRRSSRYEALGQMLTINTRNNKLAAARTDFSSHGMLDGTCLGEVIDRLREALEDAENNDSDTDSDSNSESEDGQDLDADEDEDAVTGPVDGPPPLSDITLALKCARGYPLGSIWELGKHIKQENLEALVQIFLFYHQNPNSAGAPSVSACPSIDSIEDISIFHSAKAVFCAPSNSPGVGGLYREMIRSTPKWKTSGIIAPRRDCVLLHTGSDMPGARGFEVARVHLFFSFALEEEVFECALVHEFCKSFDDPDPNNCMWVFEPDYDRDGFRLMSVIHIDSIVRAAHLLPVFKDDTPIPREINFTHTLDAFKAFYLNKYIDYHSFETLF